MLVIFETPGVCVCVCVCVCVYIVSSSCLCIHGYWAGTEESHGASRGRSLERAVAK